MEEVAMFWSGGKDSALALYKINSSNESKFKVTQLVTTLSSEFKRISMHGINENLLDKQTKALWLPLEKMWVGGKTNRDYEEALDKTLIALKRKGYSKIVFGDIFLEDLKEYRDQILQRHNMKGIYPLWKKETKDIIVEFLESGFKTVTCCVNDAYLGEENVGVLLDRQMIDELPVNVDPCGENGEFHTFVVDGPIFKQAVSYSAGKKVYKPLEIKIKESEGNKTITKGFWYCELK